MAEYRSQWDGVMDAFNIISLLIGLQNLELNITAQDMDSQTNAILEDLHKYFERQEAHLFRQDKHLYDQDLRLDKLEKSLYGEENSNERKVSTR